MITEHPSSRKNDIPNVYPFRVFSKVQPGKTPRILAYRAGFPRAFLDPLLPSVHDKMLVIVDPTEQMLGFLLECPLSEANALTLCCLKRRPVEACSGHQCTCTHARVWTHHTHTPGQDRAADVPKGHLSCCTKPNPNARQHSPHVSRTRGSSPWLCFHCLRI